MFNLLKKLFVKDTSSTESCCGFPWHYKSDGKFIEKAVLANKS